MKKKIYQIILVIIGTAVAAYGMDLAIHAGFGSATLAVLWQGLSKQLNITLGQASLIVAVLMIVFCLLYDKKQINIGTIIYQVVYSACIDLFKPILIYSECRVINVALMLFGICVFAFGSALYSVANFGRGSYEALTFSFVDKKGWSIQCVRIVLDISCVVVGFMLGGKIGICTIATILLSGVILQTCVKMLKKCKSFAYF